MISIYDVIFEASNDIAPANNKQTQEAEEIIEKSLPTSIDNNNKSRTLEENTCTIGFTRPV